MHFKISDKFKIQYKSYTDQFFPIIIYGFTHNPGKND